MESNDLKDFLKQQLDAWPMAACAFKSLTSVMTRSLNMDGFPIRLQCNPARIKSTAAKVDSSSIRNRPCFLCSSYRPAEQFSRTFIASRNYEILVNPFPIAPQHFTIAAEDHIHQDMINPGDMEAFVRLYPDYIAFYNGSAAGASAPDHLHFQVCNKDFLQNLTDSLAEDPGEMVKYTDGCRFYSCTHLPMFCLHFISEYLDEESLLWFDLLVQQDPTSLAPAIGMRNIIMWLDDDRMLHSLLMPRSAHRPSCYYAEDGDSMLVSPGAIDMAGVIILPRQEDFDRISSAHLHRIFQEVSLDYRSLPVFRDLIMR